MFGVRSAKVLTAFALGAFFALARPAAATTIGFDDLLGGGTTDMQIGNPYAGFTWDNFYVLDTVLYNSQNGPSGYSNGVVSLNNVGFTGFSETASFSAAQPFELDSFHVGAGWNDGMSVTVTGFRNGLAVATDTFLVSTSGSLLRTPHWSNIDTVTISSVGGVNHGYNGNGTQVYLDNIVVNAPEPGTLAIFGLCLATTVLLRRRAG
jgi:hypothetical protein